MSSKWTGRVWNLWRRVQGVTLLLVVAFPLSAQDPYSFKFDHIRPDQGLTNNIVYRIFQDQDGVMWFGLHHGIDRFNGYDFKHYRIDADFQKISRLRMPVRTIFPVSNEEFIVGSVRNLYRYSIKKDIFIPLVQNLASNIPSNQIHDLLVTPDSVCYIATNQGLYSYDMKGGEVSDYTSETATITSLHMLDGTILAATATGIRFFDPLQKRYYTPDFAPELQDFFGSIHAMSFYTDSIDHFTLIGTRSKGLFLYDHNSNGFKEIILDTREFSHVKVIRKYNGLFLIGMDGYGLSVLDRNFREVAHYGHDEDNRESLSNDGIYDIFIDPRDRLWIATYGGGINLYDPNRKQFSIIKHEFNNRNSLRNNMVRSFLEVDDMMLFGTANGISIQEGDGRWRHIPGLTSERESRVVLSMIQDAREQLWLATYSRGVQIRNRSGKLVRNINSRSGNGPRLSTDYIYKIYEDSKENIWMGGIRGGLMRYDPSLDSIEVFEDITNIHEIVESTTGEIFVGTNDGIVLLAMNEDSEFVRVTDRDTLLIGEIVRVFCILETSHGNFWIGTEGAGLIHYDRANEKLQQYTIDEGLPSNNVYGILEADNQDLWLSTTSGLSRYSAGAGVFKNYTVADGISGKNFNYGAYYKDREKRLYFGSQNGVTYFDPSEINENRATPKIIFTDISIFGKNADDTSNPMYELNAEQLTQLVLDHDQNSFSIDYAAINYTGTEKNRYQWKMSGGEFGDGTWSPVHSERKAVFSYLPPGDYQFRVIASNNDGHWNEEGRLLNITVKPPYWNTLLAKIIYVILGILVFIALQRYIYTYLQERQAKEKIRFFINIAHDIRTPLTLIASPMNKLIRSKKLSWEEQEEIRIAIKNSERLKSLINQLLEFQKVSLRKQPLSVAEYDVISLVDEVLNNFQPLMDERMISVKTEFVAASLMAWFDYQKIEKILYNLVSNAIKYSDKGGAVFVEVQQKNDKIIISVADEGKGIPSKQQKEIFKRYFRAQNAMNTRETGSGVGLMLSKKLIELHKGSIRFNSTENVGSRFIIEFPGGKNAYRPMEMLPAEILEKEQEQQMVDNEYEEIAFSREYTLLVVEDNSELRNHIKNQLTSNYNVLTAANGVQAYEKILKMDVDLIISDVMMPQMDGKELCQKVRNNIATCHIPIIMLTALNSMQDKMEGLEYGADAYLEKPFEIDHLKIRIANLIKARERLRERFLDQPDNQVGQDISSKPDQELMIRLNDMVRERVLKEDFSVQEMCRMVGMSRPVLYRKLKAYTGHSPQEYIIILRLNHASRMFRDGHRSIKEVAYESGFSDPKYFSKSFKKHYGVSPSIYISGEMAGRPEE